LDLRYLEPILIHHPATIRARRIRTARNLHYLEAVISQDGRVRAAATGTFMDVGG